MGIPGVQAHTRLGRYELLARLATGGMGEIFLARLQGAAGFEKLYVVKRILPHLADDTRFRQMLIAEARIAAKMSHANICQVYELGETDGQLYIVMEYLDGVTMLPLLRKSSKENTMLDYGFIAAVVQQTCDALHYAHELKERGEPIGLVHRDVTPSNIFLTESGIAKVLDFGIAKAKGASTNTQEGTVKGKYAYMAPEQLRGAVIDRRVDVFALGVVLYEMLALRRLFQRKTDYLTFRAVMEQPIPEIRRYREDVPEALEAALARALDRDPTNRFDSARQFASVVLDAITPVKRPWTQGEIGDFVRANFAEEIGRRSQQVASAIHRTASGVQSQRATMPLIAHGAQTSEESDEDVEFPSVETDAIKVPPPKRLTTPDFQTVTPPPVAGDSSTSGAQLVPLRGSPVRDPSRASAPMMLAPQRSLVWPIVAIAGIAVAGGALFLVWKQMQEQQPPPKIEITQNQLPPSPTPTPTPAAMPPTPTPEPTPTPIPTLAGTKPVKTPPPTDPKVAYQKIIDQHNGAIARCIADHPDPAPPRQIPIHVDINANGRANKVTVGPASLDGALRTCVTSVWSGTQFPKIARTLDFTYNVP